MFTAAELICQLRYSNAAEQTTVSTGEKEQTATPLVSKGCRLARVS